MAVGSSTLTSGSEAVQVYKFNSFDRHASVEATYFQTATWTTDIFNIFIYVSYPNLDDNHKCSSVCLVEEGPCELFIVVGTTCYLGRFDHFTGGVLAGTAGPFPYIHAEYSATIPPIITAYFDAYSSPREWRDHIYETKAGVNSLNECGIWCYSDANCGYFVLTAGNDCYKGRIGHTPSLLSGTGPDPQTVYNLNRKCKFNPSLIRFLNAFVAVFDRHTSVVSTTFTPSNTNFGVDEVFNEFIDDSIANIPDEHVCSTYCLLSACELFILVGTTCYMGKFSSSGGGVLSGQVGPFHYIPQALTDAVTAITPDMLTIPSSNLEWPLFEHTSKTAGSAEECYYMCLFDTSPAQCSYYVYEATTCHMGNVGNTPGSSGTVTDNAVVLISGFSNYASQVGNYFTISDPSNGFADALWPTLIYAEQAGTGFTNHECSSLCLLRTGPCQFFYTAPDGSKCYFGTFMTQTNGGFLPATPDTNVYFRNGVYDGDIEIDTDRYGNDIIFFDFTPTFSDCQAHCTANAGCEFFLLDPHIQRCWVKDVNALSTAQTSLVDFKGCVADCQASVDPSEIYI